MRTELAILSGIVTFAATLPYIVDTLRGKTKPNIVTWFTWGSLSAIAAIAAVSAHAVQTAIFAVALAVANYCIVVAGLRDGIKKYGRFDVVCQVLAIIGIILWRITQQPALAVIFVILSDMIGALPTYRHAWQRPHEETLSSFSLYLFADAIILAALSRWSFVAAAYPLYITASSLSIVIILVGRRRQMVRT